MEKDSKAKTGNSLRGVVIILLLASVFIPATVFGVMKVIEIRSGAQPTESPKDIEVTNIFDTSATISWSTPGGKSIGYVKYGETANLDKIAFDKRDAKKAEGKYTVHYVELVDLSPSTLYYYSIFVDGKEHKKNESEYYTFTTGAILENLNVPLPVKGAVEDNSESDEEIIVYLYAQKDTNISNKISVLTKNKKYTLDLSNLRVADLSEFFNDFDGATLYIMAQGGDRGKGDVKTEVLRLTE